MYTDYLLGFCFSEFKDDLCTLTCGPSLTAEGVVVAAVLP